METSQAQPQSMEFSDCDSVLPREHFFHKKDQNWLHKSTKSLPRNGLRVPAGSVGVTLRGRAHSDLPKSGGP